MEVQLGKFRLGRKLGEGGMGRVYEALQEDLERTVAVKVLPKSMANDSTFVERFRREAKSVARLNHPNIVTIYEIGEDAGSHFFAMELVDGISLEQILRDNGPIPAAQAVDMLKQCVTGLAHAWGQGIIHRDLKPANILLSKSGIIKIADFGLAKLSNELTGVTQTNASMGTLYYMSPEQGSNARDVDYRADIYSLGATFYHLLSGRYPFEASTPFEVAVKIATAPLTPLREANEEVPPTLATIVEKMMSREPENRYADADEILSALDKCDVALNSILPNTDQQQTASKSNERGDAELGNKSDTTPGSKPPTDAGNRFERTVRNGRSWISRRFIAGVVAVGSLAALVTVVSAPGAVRLTITADAIPDNDVKIVTQLNGENFVIPKVGSHWITKLEPGSYRLELIGPKADSFTLDQYDINIKVGAPTDLALRKKLPPYKIQLSNASVVENSPPGTVIGTIAVLDPDLPHDEHVLRLADDMDAQFQVSDNQLVVGENQNFDFEGQDYHSILIEAYDRAGLEFTQELVIQVIDVNEAPSSITVGERSNNWSVPPDTDVGTILTRLQVNDDRDSDETCNLQLAPAERRFSLEERNLCLAQKLAPGTYTLELTATDSEGLEYVQPTEITVFGVTSIMTQRQVFSNSSGVRLLAFAPEGKIISSGERLAFYDVSGNMTIPENQTEVTALAVSPIGNRYALASAGGGVSLWTNDGNMISTHTKHTGPVRTLAFSPDGQSLASGGDDSKIILWNSDGETETLEYHSGSVQCVALTSDGLLYSSSLDGTLRVRPVQSRGAPSGRPINEIGSPRVFDIAANGSLAVACGDNSIMLWNSTVFHTVSGHQGDIWDVAFSPNGKLLASTGADNTIRLWDVTLGTQSFYEFEVSPSDQPRHLAFSPDGKTLASTNDNGSIVLWDIERERVDDSQREILVRPNAIWKFLDDGSDQGDAWNNEEYDDTAWKEGPGQLGYGDGDEATPVDYVVDDGGGKNITTYFRHRFQIENVADIKDAVVALLRDDGAAVYLNGVQVIRDNLAANARFDTPTISNTGQIESFWTYFQIDSSLFKDGENILAVEVHQGDAGSTDMSFQLVMSCLRGG